MKMSKKKFYAIKVGKEGIKNQILESWNECSKLVLGFNSEYKGFKTREEAEKYLGINSDHSIDNRIKEQITINNRGKEKNITKHKKKKQKTKQENNIHKNKSELNEDEIIFLKDWIKNKKLMQLQEKEIILSDKFKATTLEIEVNIHKKLDDFCYKNKRTKKEIINEALLKFLS